MDERANSLFDELMEQNSSSDTTPTPTPKQASPEKQTAAPTDAYTLDIREVLELQGQKHEESKGSISVDDYAVFDQDEEHTFLDIELPPFATRSNTVSDANAAPLPTITPASEAEDTPGFSMDDYATEDMEEEDLEQMAFGCTVADTIAEHEIASAYHAELEFPEEPSVSEQNRLTINLNLFEDTPTEDTAPEDIAAEEHLATTDAMNSEDYAAPTQALTEESISLEEVLKTSAPQANTATSAKAPQNASSDSTEQAQKRRKRLSDGVMADPRVEQDPFEYRFEKPKKKKKSFFKSLVEFVFICALAFLAATAINSYILINAQIPSESMLPTVEVGDRIFGNRLAYLNADPQRCDIIIFAYPDDPNRTFIKRVIGLPGETVEIIDGVVYITPADGGETFPLEEPYILDEEPNARCKNYGPITVPENSYFVMGDNRNGSNDSRFWGNTFVERDAIYAKAMLRYWPLDRIQLMD